MLEFVNLKQKIKAVNSEAETGTLGDVCADYHNSRVVPEGAKLI